MINRKTLFMDPHARAVKQSHVLNIHGKKDETVSPFCMIITLRDIGSRRADLVQVLGFIRDTDQTQARQLDHGRPTCSAELRIERYCLGHSMTIIHT